MTTSIIPHLENEYTVSPQHPKYSNRYCTILWRRGQLLVKSVGKLKQPYLPVIDDEKQLVDCLKHSSINLVNIDPKIGIYRLKFWANACQKANKPIFLNIPSSYKWRKPNHKLGGLFRLIDWLLALILLLSLTPIMLVLILIIQFYSPSSLLSYQWCVGERGKLFRLIKFNINRKEKFYFLEDWLGKFGLDNLPKLWNVLRGEISLLGSRYWCLEEAVQLSLLTGESIKKFQHSAISELDQEESVLRDFRELEA
jgi:hypothetical protein